MSTGNKPPIKRIIVGLIYYGILNMASFGVLYLSFEDQNTDAHTINVAGKQRMLSQRIALGVMRKQLQLEGGTLQFDKNRLIHDANLMREQHLMLVHQDSAPNRQLSTALNALYFAKTNPLYEKVLDYTKHAELIANIHTKDEMNKLDLDIFNEQEVEDLLGQLNDVVSQYEKEANEKLGHSKQICLGIIILHILALIIFYLYSIRPFIKTET